MTANVKILVDRRENVLRIPSAALRFRPPDLKEQRGREGEGAVRAAAQSTPTVGGTGVRRGAASADSQTIWVLGDDKKPRPVAVKLGVTDGSFSELTEGDLKEGQEALVGVVSKEGSTVGSPRQPFGQRGPRF
jgi:HlyD family secretion protein